MLELARSGEEDDANSEEESGQRGSETEKEGEKASPLMRLVIGGKGNGVTFVAPLKHQEPEGQQEKQEDIWMSEEHGGSRAVRREKLVEIVG